MSSNETEEFSKTSSDGVVVLFFRTEDVARETFIWLISLACLLEVSGLTLNGVVCYVMVRSKRLCRNMSNIFIFHLSVSDLVFRVFAAPLELYSSLPSTEDVSLMCKLSTFMSATCSTAVFMSLVVIAADRYSNLVFPLESLKAGKRKPYIPLTGVWVYSSICSVSFLFTIKSRAYTELPEAQGWTLQNCDNCSVLKVCDLPQDLSGQVASTLYFVLAFVLPLAVMAVLYTKIVVSLRRRSRQGVSAKTSVKSKGKAVRMMVLVLAGFVFTWGPGIILSMLRSYMLSYGIRFNEIIVLFMIAETARNCSSLVNPLIYAYYSPHFRRDFVSVCCGRPCRQYCSKLTVRKMSEQPTSVEMQRT